MKAAQFRDLIVVPVLEHIGAHSDAAVELVLGTALQESGLHHLTQMGGGPGRGVYQMEGATHDDIWLNYIAYRPELAEKVRALELPSWYVGHDGDEMEGNLYYATAMCRLQYLRRPEPLPAAGDTRGQAAYWKAFYNTYKGAGTAEDYVRSWSRLGPK